MRKSDSHRLCSLAAPGCGWVRGFRRLSLEGGHVGSAISSPVSSVTSVRGSDKRSACRLGRSDHGTVLLWFTFNILIKVYLIRVLLVLFGGFLNVD